MLQVIINRNYEVKKNEMGGAFSICGGHINF
jgi:hypothetical protein